jgi:hypothetical protein
VLRNVAKWLLIMALVAYGAYTAWLAMAANVWFILWAVPCFAGAIGLALGKPWSRYFVYVVAIFTVLGWLAVVGSVAMRGWPYHDVTRSVISLIPGLLLVAACVLAIVFVRGMYKHGKAS